MKVLMRRNVHQHFYERARGLARAIARHKLKNSKLWRFKGIQAQKRRLKNRDFQPSARDSVRHTMRECMKVIRVTRYNEKVHFYRLICGVLRHWSASTTKSSDYQPALPVKTQQSNSSSAGW